MIRYSELTPRGRMVTSILALSAFIVLLGFVGWVEGL